MTNTSQQQLRENLEQNLLDGDAIQAGQMLSADFVWEWIEAAFEKYSSRREDLRELRTLFKIMEMGGKYTDVLSKQQNRLDYISTRMEQLKKELEEL